MARNAGLPSDGNDLYRVAQRQGFGVYGKAASIRKIVKMDADEYEEHEHSTIAPSFFRDAKLTHHFHSNGKVTVFDFASLERMS